jgi:uncharacterized membrane protein
MRERRLRLAAAGLALTGVGIAGYLLYVRHGGVAPACSSGGCETVQRSAYSEIFGVPVAAFGLVGYLTLLVGNAIHGELARLGQALVALTAFGFSTYLLFVQILVIGALCDWCLASDAVTTAVLGLALLRLRAGVRQSAVGPRRRR